MTNAARVQQSTPITDRDEAVALCGSLSQLMDDLIDTVERETDLVRQGKLMEAGELSPQKARMSHEYTLKMLEMKRNNDALKALAPQELGQLQRKHNLFRALLKINLGALGAARAVSAEIMETLAAAVGKKRRTSGYGNNAQVPQSSSFVSEGVALDRGI